MPKFSLFLLRMTEAADQALVLLPGKSQFKIFLIQPLVPRPRWGGGDKYKTKLQNEHRSLC